ncbi:response regulator [bacterium]|nr:response regulator [bacterium]
MDLSSLGLMKTLGQSQALASHQELAGLVQEILELARTSLEASACVLFVLEPEGWVSLGHIGSLDEAHQYLPGEELEEPPKIQRDIMVHALGRYCLLAQGEDLQENGARTLRLLQSQIKNGLHTLHQLARIQTENARHQQEMMNRSAHLAGLSHELRTPLNAVLGFCQLLSRSPETTISQLDSLHHIQENGSHLLGMISEVVEMSRLEAGQVQLKSEPFEIQSQFRELEAQLGIVVTSKGRELAFELEGSRQVLGDSERVAQLVRHVVLTSTRLAPQGFIRLTQTYEDGGLRLEILDSGPRQTESQLEALFDPYHYAAHPAAGSTGLELAISRYYAALMDGWLKATPQADGLLWSIYLRLPTYEGDASSSLGPVENILSLHPDQPEVRVLVVDDVAINRFLLCSFLKPLGFKVREADEGQKAVDIFSEWAPQVVLTDLIMPGMSGLEAIAKMRALEGGTKAVIVAVSGSEDEITGVECDAQLHKPVRLEQVLQILHNRLHLRYTYRETEAPAEAAPVAVPPQESLQDLARAAHVGDIAWLESLLVRSLRERPEFSEFWEKCQKLVSDFHIYGLTQLLPEIEGHLESPDQRPVVLLVDDNQTNLKILYAALGGLECRCLVAQSGEEALRIARVVRPAVMLLDVLMPGWDGFETLRRLQADSRANGPSVIFLSALSDTSDKVRGLKEGATDYISKPFHPEEVAARVRLQLALRNLQDELRRRNHELAKSNQTKNELLGMAAHDLRNPLSVITGYAAILERGLAGQLPEKSKTLINNIHSTGKEMQVLLEDLLSVSQIEAGHLHLNLAPADPRALFESCVQLQNFQATAKEITLHSEITDPIPASLPLDSSKMKQAFTNLLSNAIKFSQPHTVISARLLARDGMLAWEVEDQGPGIPANELNKLFQPFQRTSVKSTGGERSTGLGLAITKRILEGHQGQITVDSEVGRGTIFALKVPLPEQSG